MASENRLQTAVDEQTGKVFDIEHEDWFATLVAGLSALYLLSTLGFFVWLLVDTWTERNFLMHHLGYGTETLTSDTYRLLAFTAIAGALGGILDGIRSLISWHAERQAYGPRFIWKDLSLPWIGATVGVLVYVTVRGGAGVLSGDFSLDQTSNGPIVAAFGLAAVAGFSSFQVFKWFDAQANRLFQVSPPKEGKDAMQIPYIPRELADALGDVEVPPKLRKPACDMWLLFSDEDRNAFLRLVRRIPEPLERLTFLTVSAPLFLLPDQ